VLPTLKSGPDPEAIISSYAADSSVNRRDETGPGMTTIRSNELLNGPNRLTDVRLAAVAGKDYVLAVENAETLIVPTPRQTSRPDD